MATSQIRRRDRRGVTPQRLLYMAMKIVRLRISEGINNVRFRNTAVIAKLMREEVEDKKFVERCAESNFTFMDSIPNSAPYWSMKKNDVCDDRSTRQTDGVPHVKYISTRTRTYFENYRN